MLHYLYPLYILNGTFNPISTGGLGEHFFAYCFVKHLFTVFGGDERKEEHFQTFPSKFEI